ncbi:MAG: adenosine kinase [Tannerellaceae bacterium]
MNTIGLGNALVDVLLKLKSDAVLAHIGIEKGAMDMIDRQQMESIQQSQVGLERSEAPGGSACNVMRALALLGGKSGFIGKIGSDEAGLGYEKALLKANVAPYFAKTEGISGCCTVLISPDGERTMATFLGPAATLTPDDVTDEMLKGFDCIYIEGYLLVNEALVRHTMQKAKELGMKVALDLSNFNIVNAFKELLNEIIPKYVDILFSNESEAAAFTGLQAADAARKLSGMVDVALVTLGKEGALAASKGELIAVPAEGGKPVDTTGAGDYFAAGFLYGQSIGASIEQSARIGSLLSGYIIDVVGAQIPDQHWEQIKLKVKAL